MRMHLALSINIPNRATLLIEYLVVWIFRFIAQFIKTNKIGLCYFVGSRTLRTPGNFQGHLSIFQESRTQRDFKANSRTILEIQGRLATLGSYRGDSTPFHSNLKILKLETAKLVFRHLQNNLTPLILSLFIKTNDISVRHTRFSNPFNSLNLYIPKYHSARSRLQRCIRYQGVKIWNDIPSEIKNKTFNLLKRNYKKCL